MDQGLAYLHQLAADQNIQGDEWQKHPDLWEHYAHVLLNTKEFIFLP